MTKLGNAKEVKGVNHLILGYDKLRKSSVDYTWRVNRMFTGEVHADRELDVLSKELKVPIAL
jgi:hypothetical protein